MNASHVTSWLLVSYRAIGRTSVTGRSNLLLFGHFPEQRGVPSIYARPSRQDRSSKLVRCSISGLRQFFQAWARPSMEPAAAPKGLRNEVQALGTGEFCGPNWLAPVRIFIIII